MRSANLSPANANVSGRPSVGAPGIKQPKLHFPQDQRHIIFSDGGVFPYTCFDQRQRPSRAFKNVNIFINAQSEFLVQNEPFLSFEPKY